MKKNKVMEISTDGCIYPVELMSLGQYLDWEMCIPSYKNIFMCLWLLQNNKTMSIESSQFVSGKH